MNQFHKKTDFRSLTYDHKSKEWYCQIGRRHIPFTVNGNEKKANIYFLIECNMLMNLCIKET